MPVCTGRQCVFGAIQIVTALTRSVSFHFLKSGLDGDIVWNV